VEDFQGPYADYLAATPDKTKTNLAGAGKNKS